MGKLSERQRGDFWLWVGVAIVIGFLAFFGLSFFAGSLKVDRLQTEFEKSARKITLLQTMRSEILASAEAEKSAVMADTDEASRAFADQSVQGAGNVEKARLAFGALIRTTGDEATRFGEFSAAWEKLRETDREILPLALQNTNIKAFRLSVGPAATALGQMTEAMDRLVAWAASMPNEAMIIRLAYQAATSALGIYALEAPHIAESADEPMAQMEAKMSSLEGKATDALSRLGQQAAGDGKQDAEAAERFFQDFMSLNRDIIQQSRTNSNIRSFASSLGQKRTAMALCLERLDALEKTVRDNAAYKATR